MRLTEHHHGHPAIQSSDRATYTIEPHQSSVAAGQRPPSPTLTYQLQTSAAGLSTRCCARPWRRPSRRTPPRHSPRQSWCSTRLRNGACPFVRVVARLRTLPQTRRHARQPINQPSNCSVRGFHTAWCALSHPTHTHTVTLKAKPPRPQGGGERVIGYLSQVHTSRPTPLPRHVRRRDTAARRPLQQAAPLQPHSHPRHRHCHHHRHYYYHPPPSHTCHCQMPLLQQQLPPPH